MKATGAVRRVDKLGRIVIPKEIRQRLDMDIGSETEIFVDDDKLIFKAVKHGCVFCNSGESLREFKSKHLCSKCRNGLVIS